MELFSIFGKSSTVYFPECLTFFRFKESFELYKKIFNKLGISFRILKPVCSGLEPFELGYNLEARKIARKNFEIFLEEGIDKIITTSPGSHKLFLKNYKEFVPEWNVEVINLWKVIFEKLQKNPHLIKNKQFDTITYNDSCYLGRHCGIYDEPRDILRLIGYEIKEMDNTRENSFCCGSCGSLPLINPDLADEIAREKILQAKRIGIKKIVVIGLDSYSLLKNNSDIEVLEFSEVLGNALGIKIEN